MTTLLLVRHGQSQANLARTFAGHANPDLTDLGKQQAEALANYLVVAVALVAIALFTRQVQNEDGMGPLPGD